LLEYEQIAEIVCVRCVLCVCGSRYLCVCMCVHCGVSVCVCVVRMLQLKNPRVHGKNDANLSMLMRGLSFPPPSLSLSLSLLFSS